MPARSTARAPRSRAGVVRGGIGYVPRVVYAPQRSFFAVMTAFAVLIALLQGATGLTDLALYAGPALLLAGLLLCRPLRRRGAHRPAPAVRRSVVRARRVRARWPRVPARTLASLLAHDPRVERGPPAGALAA